jgi:hypothetical protein
LDPVTTAFRLVSFDCIILTSFFEIWLMLYSVHINLLFIAEISIFSLIVSQALLICLSVQILQSCELIRMRLQCDTSLYPLPHFNLSI